MVEGDIIVVVDISMLITLFCLKLVMSCYCTY